MTVTLNVPGRLWTVNAERRMNHYEHGRKTRTTREAAGWIAKASQTPALAWAEVTVAPVQRRGVLADPGNHYPPAKAAIDGLVDIGVLPGDTGEWVRSLTFRPPARGHEDSLTLILRGPRANVG